MTEKDRFMSMSHHPSLRHGKTRIISIYGDVTNASTTLDAEINVAPTGSSVEFPAGGDPRFRAVLAEMLTIHISKSHDYGTGANPYANYSAAESIGVPAWKSCFIRALEKVQRLTNAFGGKELKNESVTDSLLDLANQVVIAKVLWDTRNEA
jgi:hypothetical protein